MIHVFVGTKAQYIKMAPIMQELDRRRIAYNLIDAGQHGGITGDLIQQFQLSPPNAYLRKTRTDITTLSQALRWIIASLWQIIFHRDRVFHKVFSGESGICLIHGTIFRK